MKIVNFHYHYKTRKLTLSPQLSWFLMEVPSFLVGLMGMIHLHQLGDTHKMFLMIPFTVHYFNRSIIYPLSLNNGKKDPSPQKSPPTD